MLLPYHCQLSILVGSTRALVTRFKCLLQRLVIMLHVLVNSNSASRSASAVYSARPQSLHVQLINNADVADTRANRVDLIDIP